MLAAADRLEGIQWGSVADEEGVEEMPQPGQGLVLGRAVPGEIVDEAAGQAGRNPGELEGFPLAPGEEATHHTGVGAAGVGIGDPSGEELIGGEQGIAAGALKDYGDRSGQIEGLRGGQQDGLCRRSVHGDLGNDNKEHFLVSGGVDEIGVSRKDIIDDCDQKMCWTYFIESRG